MGKHTRRPWVLSGSGFAVLDVKTGNIICEFPNDSDDAANLNKGNAALITIAPDLFDDGHKLAMMALQSDRYGKDPEYRDAVDDLLMDIARVEGR